MDDRLEAPQNLRVLAGVCANCRHWHWTLDGDIWRCGRPGGWSGDWQDSRLRVCDGWDEREYEETA
jgi:hypothetical protein